MNDANNELKKLGVGINLDMTQVVEKQIRQMFTALKSEIQSTAKQTGDITTKMAAGLASSAKEMEHIISVTRKIGQESSLTETVKGYDTLGNQLTLVRKNAELASIALKQDGAFTKDIRYANELYTEQVAHLKRIHELRTQRLYVENDSPKATILDTQIEDTTRLYQANQE